jgi:hypothetical protein
MADAVFITTPGALLRRFLRAAAAEASAFAAAAGPPHDRRFGAGLSA